MFFYEKYLYTIFILSLSILVISKIFPSVNFIMIVILGIVYIPSIFILRYTDTKKIFFSFSCIEKNRLLHFKHSLKPLNQKELRSVFSFIIEQNKPVFLETLFSCKTVIFDNLNNIDYKNFSDDILFILFKNESFRNICKKEDINLYQKFFGEIKKENNLKAF